jgi:mRNA-degrading endonuclease RelE of RelBE toxin-antitoxin system
MGIPQHGRRKVSVLAADQTLPVFDYKALEDIVKESEFAARKNTKQVAVKIPEDLAEVQRGRIGDSRREHVPQYFA